MKKRFKELWAKAGAESNSETAFEIISAGYLEPQRFYHNLDHVWQCILVLDAISQSEPVSSAMEIELALWFHDIVYDSQKNDNEERSADFGYSMCIEAHLDSSTCEIIRDLVLITKHSKEAANQAHAVILDTDLSILGTKAEIYQDYVKNIRKEYSHVSDKDFQYSRSILLQSLLNRKSIFNTEYGLEYFEKLARLNIEHEISGYLNKF